MLFRRKRIDLAELPLEEVRFSTEDLFVLLNGFDGCAVVVNPYKIRLDLVERKKPERNEWRRAVAERYSSSGWVDAEANPNPELARALAALGQMGVSIADSITPQDRTMGVTMGAAGACGVVQAPGGGWYLRPFPDDRSRWPAKFRELFVPRRYPFLPAEEGGHSSFPKEKVRVLYSGPPSSRATRRLCGRSRRGRAWTPSP
jgi:hypothetical protein